MESNQSSTDESFRDQGQASNQPMDLNDDSTMRKFVTDGEELLRKTHEHETRRR